MCIRDRYQTVTLMPSFLSWVVVGYMVYALLMPGPMGLVNQIIMLFGGEPVDWYSQPGYWPVILLIVKLWHGVGYNSLFYYASLMGIDKEFFEAAQLDGATKTQEFRYIILPFLKPIIIVMTLLNIGNIFRADFGLFFNVPRNVGALYPATDVIDTYVYRALTQLGNVGMSAAVGLVQSVVGFALILATNLVAVSYTHLPASTSGFETGMLVLLRVWRRGKSWSARRTGSVRQWHPIRLPQGQSLPAPSPWDALEADTQHLEFS